MGLFSHFLFISPPRFPAGERCRRDCRSWIARQSCRPGGGAAERHHRREEIRDFVHESGFVLHFEVRVSVPFEVLRRSGSGRCSTMSRSDFYHLDFENSLILLDDLASFRIFR